MEETENANRFSFELFAWKLSTMKINPDDDITERLIIDYSIEYLSVRNLIAVILDVFFHRTKEKITRRHLDVFLLSICKR